MRREGAGVKERRGGAQEPQILRPPRSPTVAVAITPGEPTSRAVARSSPGMQPPALPVPGPLALLDTIGEGSWSILAGSPGAPARPGAQVQSFPPPCSFIWATLALAQALHHSYSRSPLLSSCLCLSLSLCISPCLLPTTFH